MKAKFNGICEHCIRLVGRDKAFKPRCAIVFYQGRKQTLCSECRKKIRGKYSLDATHK